MHEVTLVITTHNRTDLLERTLRSFFKYNTYPIAKTIIIEDSGIKQDFQTVEKIVQGPLQLIINEVNLGQIASIDRAYAAVNTDYIFHCEEDWEFHEPCFIEKSFSILATDSKIFTVWLRAHNDTNGHGILFDQPLQSSEGEQYYLMEAARKKHWCGFTFNPGLRRTRDCMLFHPYNELQVRKQKNGLMVMGEIDLSIYYQEQGYRAAITSKSEGYVTHIGGKRHVPLPWQQ